MLDARRACAQVVVDAFDPSLLVSSVASRVFDLMTVPEADLLDITVPLSLQVRECGGPAAHACPHAPMPERGGGACMHAWLG